MDPSAGFPIPGPFGVPAVPAGFPAAAGFGGDMVAAAAPSEVPVCDRCSHAHAEDAACKQCGHRGRQVIFPGPSDPQPAPFEVRVALYFLSRETNAVTIGHQRLAILLRSRVLVEELGMLAPPALRTGSTRRVETKDSDAHDLTARHFLVYYGDAPVAYARWRVILANVVDEPVVGASGVPVPSADDLLVVIDRFITLPDYRKRGFGRHVLSQALMDIATLLSQMQAKVLRVSMFIPVHEKCVPAANVAVACRLALTGGVRPTNPIEKLADTFDHRGVQEFSIPAHTLVEMYSSMVRAPEPVGSGAAAAGSGV